MVSTEWLKEICMPPGSGKAYYRPFICNRDLSKVDIFFVGTNPATPIFPSNMDIDRYVSLLLNYENFISYYKTSRRNQGKDEVSRTRIGMNSFLSWLSEHTDAAIMETEAIPYPTAKLKQLKKEPAYVIEKGKGIFYQLVLEFRPSLLILHGKKTVEHVIETLVHNGLILPGKVDLELTIEEMETHSPLVEIAYPNGKVGTMMACRHFMYYGTKGDSYEPFRNRVLGRLNG
jgi:hypothetical protein